VNIEDLADHFEKVKFRGRGFTAVCPAHEDRSPSLSVSEGLEHTLVHCFAGCSFFEIVAAAGLRPLDFASEGGRSRTEPYHDTMNARARLARMAGLGKRAVTRFDEVASVALEPSDRVMATTGVKYPLVMSMGFTEAMNMWNVTMDGPVWELVTDYRQYGKDWHEARTAISKLLSRTWKGLR